jgi:hypothetical protein
LLILQGDFCFGISYYLDNFKKSIFCFGLTESLVIRRSRAIETFSDLDIVFRIITSMFGRGIAGQTIVQNPQQNTEAQYEETHRRRTPRAHPFRPR